MSDQILSGVIIGVVVAVVGTIVSHILVSRREKERWEREDAYRDYVELKESCVQFLNASDRIWNGARDKEAFGKFRLRWIELRLVATQEITRAATELYMLILGLAPELSSSVDTAEYGEKVNNLVDTVRSELEKPPANWYLTQKDNQGNEILKGEG